MQIINNYRDRIGGAWASLSRVADDRANPRFSFNTRTPMHCPIHRKTPTFFVALCAALSGCANSTMFENRLMCNLDGSGGVVVSRWGGFGIASNIADEDIKRVCAAQQKGIE